MTYEFTAWRESDLVSGDLGYGSTFYMPSTATTSFSVSDNDAYLSGDSNYNENADDSYGQHASITADGAEIGNGGQIYAEVYHWVYDQSGNWYLLIEIEQEGTSGDYFTFHEAYGIPPAGAKLTVDSSCNIYDGGWQPDYKCLTAGEVPQFSSISGRVFCDLDCDGVDGKQEIVEPECVFGENLIVNGDFENNPLSNSGWGTFSSIEGWYAIRDKIEVQESNYNTGNTQGNAVVELDANSNAVICQQVKITEAGTYKFSLDYAMRGTDASTNGFKVYIDGVLQATVRPTTPGFQTLEFEVDLAAGTSRIDLKGIGTSDCIGTVIDNVSLQKKTVIIPPEAQCILGEDLIVNGDFENNPLSDNGAIWNASSSDLPGWFFLGSNTADLLEYNAEGHGNRTGDAVVELDQGSVLCQNVTVEDSGTYLLTLDVLENPYLSSSDNRVKILVNGRSVETVIADGQKTVTIELELEAGVNRLDLKSLSYAGDGPAVDNIKLQKKIYIVNEPEPGKEGVEVKLVNAEGVVVATTMTDADGNYSFDKVPDGDYTVMFTAPDGTEFTLQDVGGNDAIDSDVNAGGTTGVISVSNGDVVTDIDAGVKEIKDPGTAALSGRYFCDENDNSLDDGEPGVGGILVTLLNGDGSPTGRTTTTAADGSYSFTGLNAGSYKVQFADDPTGKVFVDPNVGGDDTIDSDVDPANGMSGVIDLAVGETKTDIDAGVEDPGTAALSGRYFCDENDNSLDDGEPGVGGILVTLLNGDGSPTGRTTTTASDGSYSFTGLSAGSYKVQFADDPTGKVFVDPNVGGDDTIDSDVDPANGMTGVIDLAVGETKTDIDAGVEDPGTAALSGRYFCDENDNSLDDGEPGVGGILVTLLNADGSPTGRTTVTDGDGNYRFDGLRAGDYKVQFESDPTGKEFVDQDVDGNASDDIDSDVDPVNGMTGVVTVVTGEETTDVDAGVEDPGTAALSGRYFCDENDNSLDDGEPGVGGILVTLLNGDGSPTGRTTTTAADGSYSFTGLSAGSYKVQFADDPTGKVFVDPNVGGDDTIDSDVDPANGMTGVIDLAVGETKTDIDAGVEDPGTAALSGRYFCDENDNSLDDGEPGVGGILVTLLNADGSPTGRTTVTDGDGNYRFDGLRAGDYKVQFESDPTGKEFVDQDVDGNASDDIDSDVDPVNGMTGVVTVVTGEETTDVDAGVEDPGTAALSGRYFCDENDNSLDDGEPGVGGILVTLLNGDGSPTGRTTTTAADGSYSFTGLSAGSYKVQFADDPTGKVFVDPNVGGDDTIDSDVDPANGMTGVIDLAVGETKTDIDAGVEDPGTAALSGRYFCDENDNSLDDGEPGVGGILVTLLNADGSPTGRTTVTDGDGNYRFDGLRAGDYKVQFESDPTGKEFVDQDVDGNASDDIDSDVDPVNGMTGVVTVVTGEETTDVDAGVEDPGTAALSGRYFCDENDNSLDDGEPGVGGVLVTLLNGDGSPTGRTTTTASDGSYSFTGLSAGSYKVQFADDPTGKVFVDPNVGGDDTIDSDVDPANGMTGVIDLAVGETKTDIDAGVEDPGTAALSGRYFCDENDNSLDDGEPGVGGILVTLLNADGSPTGRTTVTDGDGNYRFDGLRAGDYKVQFESDPTGKEFVDQDVDGNASDDIDSDVDPVNGMTGVVTVVTGEETTDVDAGVEDPGTAALSGRYFCDENDNSLDDGEPGVGGILVTLLNGDGSPTGRTTTTAADGSYSFTGLSAGSYKVQFADDPTGKVFVDPNVGGDDTIDSDVDPANGMTGVIDLAVGETKTDIDAGVEKLNGNPEPEDDAATTCYDELAKVDVLANDSDPDGDVITITAVNGIAISEGGPAIDIGGVLVTLEGGQLCFDGSIAYADLLTGEEVTDSFEYSVSDGNGGTASATVDVTFCGATDTIEKIKASLPASLTFQIVDENNPAGSSSDAFTMFVSGTSDDRLLGTYENAYCLSAFEDYLAGTFGTDITTAPLITADVDVANADCVDPADLSGQVGVNGESALNNLDLVNWIINQDFESVDNGDGTATTYTDGEIQGAIWALTDGERLEELGFSGGVFVADGGGTSDNAQEIVDAALASGEGFEAGDGDLVGLFLDPTAPDGHTQPFIIAIDLFDECIC